MFERLERDQAQRWIAGAGWICIGAGSLWAVGCAGGSRDRIAAADAAAIQEAASGGAPGRASLSDRPIAGSKSRGNRAPAVARTGNGQTVAGRATVGGATVGGATVGARVPEMAQTVGQKYPQPAPGPEASLPEIETETTVAATQRPPIKVPVQRPKAPAADARPTVAQAQSKTNSTAGSRKDRTISQASASQASAKVAAESRRPKPPVITPATRDVDTDSPAGEAGFERLRADRLMTQARKMLQNDFPDEALRLAAIAEQLEKSRQALYQPGEDRPSELVTQIRRKMASGDTSPAGADQKADVVQRKVYKSLSVPAEPIPVGIKRGHVELTEIRSGWRSTAEADAAGAEASEASSIADQKADAGLGGLSTSGLFETAPAPAGDLAVALRSDVAATEPAPAPIATADYPTDDLADPETVSEPAPTVQAGWSKTSIIGLIAGASGLFGLFFWRRRERTHFDALKQ